jgi:uncharacterized protein
MKRIILAVIAVFVASAAVAFDVPSLNGRVNDNAKLLSGSELSSLADRIKTFEGQAKNGAQIAVLTVPSLDGESIDKVRSDVFRAWHLGQAGKDNGVLIVVAPVERKVAIEVGYGLESVIPDIAAARIIDQMKPSLKKGAENWFRALDGAVVSLGAAVLASEQIVAAPDRPNGSGFLIFLGCVGAVLLLGGAGAVMIASANARRAREAKALEDAARQNATPRRSYYRSVPRSAYPQQANAAAVGAGAAVAASSSRSRISSDTPSRSSWSSSSDSGSSYSSSSSSDSSSSYSGGGGDSGGGGSSSDF